MIHVTLDVSLELEGPVLTHSTAPGNPGIDAAIARTRDGKEFILPGTLVKGRLLDAWNELRAAAPRDFTPDIAQWLGDESGNTRRAAAGVEPRRGKLRFTDFRCPVPDTTEVRCRIQIDDRRGSVVKGAYQVIESPFAPGQTVTFRGAVRFFSASEDETRSIRTCVATGLKWIPAFGAFQTIGFGRLIGVALAENSLKVEPVTEASSECETLDLILTPDAAFCVARLQPDGNLFESDEVIPGGALKGGLARTWREMLGESSNGPIDEYIAAADPDRRELAGAFEKIGFTHAFPASRCDGSVPHLRPVRPPLSLVEARSQTGNEIRDLALCNGPALLFGVAPAFDIDWKWKTRADVDGLFGWPSLTRDLRIHTAIDANTRRSAKTQLFAYDMIVPEQRPWLARIDLSRVDPAERPKVEAQLRSLLLIGVHGIGKTDVSAKAEVKLAGAIVDAVDSTPLKLIDGHYIVTLQTDAILCDPSQLDESSESKELEAAYAQVWNELTKGQLSLVRYFARQALAGGDYLHRRFQAGRPYVPYLLTLAGSVFVLKSTPGHEPNAAARLAEWSRSGLPLPEWAIRAFTRDGKPGCHWSNCPYIRENGYGEIVVNLDAHSAPRPGLGELTPIKQESSS